MLNAMGIGLPKGTITTVLPRLTKLEEFRLMFEAYRLKSYAQAPEQSLYRLLISSQTEQPCHAIGTIEDGRC